MRGIGGEGGEALGGGRAGCGIWAEVREAWARLASCVLRLASCVFDAQRKTQERTTVKGATVRAPTWVGLPAPSASE